uniref:Uncharacterized protein n=1 Tax=Oryza barthii TaxID=65489 RepID=A0A0D3H0D3_9ORYZ
MEGGSRCKHRHKPSRRLHQISEGADDSRVFPAPSRVSSPSHPPPVAVLIHAAGLLRPRRILGRGVLLPLTPSIPPPAAALLLSPDPGLLPCSKVLEWVGRLVRCT